jgi:hypothetical protein
MKNQEFMSKTNFFLNTLPFNPWAVLATWLYVGKLKIISVLNKTPPWIHMKSELDVFGIQ